MLATTTEEVDLEVLADKPAVDVVVLVIVIEIVVLAAAVDCVVLTAKDVWVVLGAGPPELVAEAAKDLLVVVVEAWVELGMEDELKGPALRLPPIVELDVLKVTDAPLFNSNVDVVTDGTALDEVIDAAALDKPVRLDDVVVPEPDTLDATPYVEVVAVLTKLAVLDELVILVDVVVTELANPDEVPDIDDTPEAEEEPAPALKFDVVVFTGAAALNEPV